MSSLPTNSSDFPPTFTLSRVPTKPWEHRIGKTVPCAEWNVLDEDSLDLDPSDCVLVLKNAKHTTAQIQVAIDDLITFDNKETVWLAIHNPLHQNACDVFGYVTLKHVWKMCSLLVGWTSLQHSIVHFLATIRGLHYEGHVKLLVAPMVPLPDKGLEWPIVMEDDTIAAIFSTVADSPFLPIRQLKIKDHFVTSTQLQTMQKHADDIARDRPLFSLGFRVMVSDMLRGSDEWRALTSSATTHPERANWELFFPFIDEHKEKQVVDPDFLDVDGNFETDNTAYYKSTRPSKARKSIMACKSVVRPRKGHF